MADVGGLSDLPHKTGRHGPAEPWGRAQRYRALRTYPPTTAQTSPSRPHSTPRSSDTIPFAVPCGSAWN